MLALFCAVAQAYTYDSGRNQDRIVRPNQLPDSNEGCAKGAIAISLFCEEHRRHHHSGLGDMSPAQCRMRADARWPHQQRQDQEVPSLPLGCAIWLA